MCRSMVDIQSPTAEIRRGKKEDRRKKLQGKNVMVCPITYGDHNNTDIQAMLLRLVGLFHFNDFFAVFDPLPLTRCIKCSFFTFIWLMAAKISRFLKSKWPTKHRHISVTVWPIARKFTLMRDSLFRFSKCVLVKHPTPHINSDLSTSLWAFLFWMHMTT